MDSVHVWSLVLVDGIYSADERQTFDMFGSQSKTTSFHPLLVFREILCVLCATYDCEFFGDIFGSLSKTTSFRPLLVFREVDHVLCAAIMSF